MLGFQRCLMARRCCGITRAGKPCSITSTSTLTNDAGRLAAEPLRRGSEHCLFHAKPFCVRPVGRDTGDLSNRVVVMLDCESTGVDITRDRIVEIAALHCPSDPRFFGGGFSTVVRVHPAILAERGAAAAAVHGITDAEIAAGPEFAVAWNRFLSWIEDLLNTALVEEEADSDDNEPRPPSLLPDTPGLLLVGHNALRFDFPFLLCECLRHRAPCDCFQEWLFADTLHVAQAAEEHGCRKLQCLVRTLGRFEDLRAHRAFDDCVALRHVGVALAERLGLDLPTFLRRFAVELDVPRSLAQLSVLMES